MTICLKTFNYAFDAWPIYAWVILYMKVKRLCGSHTGQLIFHIKGYIFFFIVNWDRWKVLRNINLYITCPAYCWIPNFCSQRAIAIYVYMDGYTHTHTHGLKNSQRNVDYRWWILKTFQKQIHSCCTEVTSMFRMFTYVLICAHPHHQWWQVLW